MVFKETKIKNIREVTGPLKEEILNGNVHTIDEMKAWLRPLGYSDAINEASIKSILREFVMSEVSTDVMCNMDMIVELLRPQLEVTKKDIEPFRIMMFCSKHYHKVVKHRTTYKKMFHINNREINNLKEVV